MVTGKNNYLKALLKCSERPTQTKTLSEHPNFVHVKIEVFNSPDAAYFAVFRFKNDHS
jgi:hypothetical protein